MIEAWIETVSGVQFHFLNPDPSEIKITDIAHALSNNCRFVGQCRKFYSVAEHSWHVARMLEGTPAIVQLAGLLHDASEAYITDVASPVKQFMPEYIKMEDTIMTAIASKYGFEYPFHPAIKLADLSMLSNEAHHLLISRGNDWDMWFNRKRPAVSDTYKPICMEPDVARELFLDKFTELAAAVRLEKKNERIDRATA